VPPYHTGGQGMTIRIDHSRHPPLSAMKNPNVLIADARR
jgi:hypothetical protein